MACPQPSGLRQIGSTVKGSPVVELRSGRGSAQVHQTFGFVFVLPTSVGLGEGFEPTPA